MAYGDTKNIKIGWIGGAIVTTIVALAICFLGVQIRETSIAQAKAKACVSSPR